MEGDRGNRIKEWEERGEEEEESVGKEQKEYVKIRKEKREGKRKEGKIM